MRFDSKNYNLKLRFSFGCTSSCHEYHSVTNMIAIWTATHILPFVTGGFLSQTAINTENFLHHDVIMESNKITWQSRFSTMGNIRRCSTADLWIESLQWGWRVLEVLFQALFVQDYMGVYISRTKYTPFLFRNYGSIQGVVLLSLSKQLGQRPRFPDPGNWVCRQRKIITVQVCYHIVLILETSSVIACSKLWGSCKGSLGSWEESIRQLWGSVRKPWG